MDKINTILNYWFEGVDDASPIDTNKRPFKKWFVEDKDMDREIKEKFEEELDKAAKGQYKSWEGSPKGRLALVILYDQFSRNMFRNTPRMYAYDALALELTLRTIHEGLDRKLMLIERAFMYLPLMHFEDISLQDVSVEHFTRLIDECRQKNAANVHYYEYTLKYAKEHRDTVKEHGRFPHRDAILERQAS